YLACADPTTPETYPPSLHDALPISDPVQIPGRGPALLIGDLGREPHSGTVVTAAAGARIGVVELTDEELHPALAGCFEVEHRPRSEEHTSELQSRFDLVCRLLLANK